MSYLDLRKKAIKSRQPMAGSCCCGGRVARVTPTPP
jgi:hypothetical protein